jgi:hypothetical protein
MKISGNLLLKDELLRIATGITVYKDQHIEETQYYEFSNSKLNPHFVNKFYELLLPHSDKFEYPVDKTLFRTISSVRDVYSGNHDDYIPNFDSFGEILKGFIAKDAIDFWVYIKKDDGFFYAGAVSDIHERSNRNEDPCFVMEIVYRNFEGIVRESFWFEPQEVSRKDVKKVLMSKGIFKEDKNLKENYIEEISYFNECVVRRFAEQFEFSGRSLDSRNGRNEGVISTKNRRVVHDVDDTLFLDESLHIVNKLNIKLPDVEVPLITVLRVFDLVSHKFFVTNTGNLLEHKYDDTIIDKIILPESHKELLEVLTDDLTDFSKDIVEGKTAGNTILCQGIFGVGKTLTAEIYSEMVKRPLYRVNCSDLGLSASNIDSNLNKVFSKAERWGAILLIDEADIFVTQRGVNIEQNAIVGVFLQNLEYYDGLVFLTTNLIDSIDGAILSRCAAIIKYQPPKGDDAKKVWKVMCNNFGVQIEDELIDLLMKNFPTIVPRDIKMLLRLTLRFSKKRGEPVSIDLFRRCAIYRNIEMID